MSFNIAFEALDALAKGEAVVVPKEPTEEQLQVSWIQAGESESLRKKYFARARRHYQLMIAKSPFNTENS